MISLKKLQVRSAHNRKKMSADVSSPDTKKSNNHGTNIYDKSEIALESLGTDYSYKHTVLWINASSMLLLHLLGLWGIILMFTGQLHWQTFVWGFIVRLFIAAVMIGQVGGEGITIAAHRYYTHRTFKAVAGLRLWFLLIQTLAGQNSMYTWVRDHRAHHKYSDTDADPHNARRGLFFSHVGWLMCKKHPYVKEYGKRIDMKDLEADWMVMFQKKYFLYIYAIVGIIIPVYVPVHFWNEDWLTSTLVCYFGRYILQLNITWTVNSLAHFYGTRPYDRNLLPVESWFVSFLTSGEGWHNYHHAFPWDYQCAEFSMRFNQSAKIIRFFERMGWAYDLKTVSQAMLDKRILRTGDGSHYELGTDEGQAAVTAFGPVHPFNPTYTTTMKPPETSLKSDGYQLYHESDTFNIPIQDRTTTAG